MASAAKSTPKDALTMAAILEDMGITNYEPRVVNQMLEFSYKYMTEVLEGASVYSSHASKRNIDIDDVKIAVQTKLDHTLTNPPPRDLLLDVARHKNSVPLPLIKPIGASVLPPDRYCLTSINYKLKQRQMKWSGVSMPQKASKTNGNTVLSTAVSGNKISGTGTSIFRTLPPANVTLLSTSSAAAAAGGIVSTEPTSRKRMREDDEFVSA